MSPAEVVEPAARPTAPQPSASPRRRVPWPALALLALILAAIVGTAVYPTYPNYDSYYSLLWGDEILHGHLPSFDVYRAPTEHPLAIVFGAALSLLGRSGDRIMVLATLGSFVVLAMGMYRLGKAAFTPFVGLVAAALVCSRFDFPFLAARAYIDIPYLAFVIWAAALEVERPRRGMPVLALLACASLMRPEAWLIIGLYFLWIAVPATWPQRVRYAAVTALGPVVWAGLDFIVTGEPMFSLTHTSGLAEELGRNKGLSEVPHATWAFLVQLDKFPVVLAAIAGVLIAVWVAPRRSLLPGGLLLVGIGTFFAVGVAGLSIINRYLLVPSLMVMVFAAVALGGWTMLREGALIRRAWAGGAALVVVYGVVFTITHVNFHVFTNNLKFRGASHRALVSLLDDGKVRAGVRCGPLSVPNHKLIPEARWILAADRRGVLARSDETAQRRTRQGAALIVVDRTALLQEQLLAPTDDFDLVQRQLLPPGGFNFVRATRYFSAYVRC